MYKLHFRKKVVYIVFHHKGTVVDENIAILEWRIRQSVCFQHYRCVLNSYIMT
jgi:hypothetical protein